MKKAVVLLSGGMDSATVLAYAKQQGFEVYALSLAYGQRHSAELIAAKNIAHELGAHTHRLIQVDIGQWGGSSLTDSQQDIPTTPTEGIPSTYVPARNTIMLSLALSWAEALGAYDLFIGVNAVDYSGYPDCRPEYIQAFETLTNLATQAGIEGRKFKVHTPLQHLTKADIIRMGHNLGIDFHTTTSCYQADSEGKACGHCDACRLRKKGFVDAGLPDQTYYACS